MVRLIFVVNVKNYVQCNVLNTELNEALICLNQDKP